MRLNQEAKTLRSVAKRESQTQREETQISKSEEHNIWFLSPLITACMFKLTFYAQTSSMMCIKLYI